MVKIIPHKKTVKHAISSTIWFLVGFILAGTLLASAVLIYFQHSYRDRVIPGIFIGNIYVGEKTKEEVRQIFDDKNKKIGENTFVFSGGGLTASVSAQTLGIGYDTNLITDQALNIGKSANIASDVYIIISSYINGTFLNTPFTFDSNKLESELAPMAKATHIDPVDAEFNVEGNRVVAFKQSQDGKDLDVSSTEQKLYSMIPGFANSGNSKIVTLVIPVKTTPPKISTEQANSFGIVEPIGTGTSTFYHSIPGRIHNVALATSRINGALVAPGEEFSFDKTLGDVSSFTGYQQAYVIENGKTVLGDGGGVCQVSTTLFRALLNSGLPITERHAHAYRVGYYEQDAPPGFDATTFVPSVDLKFRNDTGHYILIQGYADTTNLTLNFTLYGKKDGRQVSISKPVLSNIAAAPPDVYQDDPTLPAGTVKQVDFAAPGAKSVFNRVVTKDGKIVIDDTFVSVYKPWQAIFLRGTKT